MFFRVTALILVLTVLACPLRRVAGAATESLRMRAERSASDAVQFGGCGCAHHGAPTQEPADEGPEQPRLPKHACQCLCSGAVTTTTIDRESIARPLLALDVVTLEPPLSHGGRAAAQVCEGGLAALGLAGAAHPGCALRFQIASLLL